MDRPQEEIDWHFERFIGIIQKMQDTGDRSPVAGLDWKQVRVEKGVYTGKSS